jgi:hypothetical protein
MEVVSKVTMIITSSSSGSLFKKTVSSSFSGSNVRFRAKFARRLARGPVMTGDTPDSTGFKVTVVSTDADKLSKELDS